MKNNIFLLFLTLFLILFLLPAFATGEPNKTFEIQGVIGDYAQEDRIFEVDGKIYQFDQDTVVEGLDGTVLSFAHLKGGTEVKIIGEKTFDPKAKIKEKIKYVKVIVLKK